MEREKQSGERASQTNCQSLWKDADEYVKNRKREKSASGSLKMDPEKVMFMDRSGAVNLKPE